MTSASARGLESERRHESSHSAPSLGCTGPLRHLAVDALRFAGGQHCLQVHRRSLRSGIANQLQFHGPPEERRTSSGQRLARRPVDARTAGWFNSYIRTTNIPCEHCGAALLDVSGMGDPRPTLRCNSTSCPSHYQHKRCPECGAGVSDVKLLGIGHQHFRCSAGHVWSSIPGQ